MSSSEPICDSTAPLGNSRIRLATDSLRPKKKPSPPCEAGSLRQSRSRCAAWLIQICGARKWLLGSFEANGPAKWRPYFGYFCMGVIVIGCLRIFGGCVRLKDLNGADFNSKRESIRRFKGKPRYCVTPPVLSIQASLDGTIRRQLSGWRHVQCNSTPFRRMQEDTTVTAGAPEN